MNKQFEDWYESKEHRGLRKKISWFNTLDFSMQWGVYLEFFDSVGIDIDTFYLDTKLFWDEGAPPWTRKPAQQEAIKKAFSLLESK